MWYEIRDAKVFRGPCAEIVGDPADGDWRPGVDTYVGPIDHTTQVWCADNCTVYSDKVVRAFSARDFGPVDRIRVIDERVSQIMSRFELLDLWSIRAIRADELLILSEYELEAQALRTELNDLRTERQALEESSVAQPGVAA